MNPSEEIDALIKKHPDWRGGRLAELRGNIRAVDPAIEETWKWMGSPVWELDGILCVGNIFKQKVQILFLYGASLPDPDGLFNAELNGNQRRGIDFFEGDALPGAKFQKIVRAAIAFNREKRAR